MNNPMEIGTTRGMATSLYSYIRRHTKKLVYRTGTTQRNGRLDILAAEFVITFAFEHENPMIDTKLKLIKENIFEELEVEIVKTYEN